MTDHVRTTRKIRQGKVDIDYDESSLIVHYDLEVITVNENGRAGDVIDRIPEIKRIKVKNLTADKSMVQLSADIVEKCKYIHPSRAEEIEQLLIKLRKHNLANPPTIKENTSDQILNNEKEIKDRKTTAGSDRGGKGAGRQEIASNVDEPLPPVDEDNLLPPASMEELDEYLDMLYQVGGNKRNEDDGLQVQIRGTTMIRKLCRVVMNLEQVRTNEDMHMHAYLNIYSCIYM